MIQAAAGLRAYYLVFERHTFGIVLLEPFCRGFRGGEHLQVLAVANLLAGVDVDKDGHDAAPQGWLQLRSRGEARRAGADGVSWVDDATDFYAVRRRSFLSKLYRAGGHLAISEGRVAWLASPHASVFEERPDIGAAVTACPAGELGLQIR